jgi:hypothetical protein
VSRDRRTTVALLCALAISFALTATPNRAAATTGATPLAHPPRFKVSDAQADPYLGRFKLVRPLGRQLISGAYIAGHNERGFVEGTIEIYHYEAAGRETIMLGRTYEYHAVGGRMSIDVISPQNQVILARLQLRPLAGGKVGGTLRSLLPPKPPERITMGPAPDPDPGADSTSEATIPEPAGAGTVSSGFTPRASAAEIAAVVQRFVRPF